MHLSSGHDVRCTLKFEDTHEEIQLPNVRYDSSGYRLRNRTVNSTPTPRTVDRQHFDDHHNGPGKAPSQETNHDQYYHRNDVNPDASGN